MTTGKVGVFFVGDEQVGGFFDWVVTVNLADSVQAGFKVFKVASWAASAKSYWFEKRVTDVEARFFCDASDYYWTAPTKLGIYRLRPGILIEEPLEFKGNGVLEVRAWTKSK